MNNRNVLETLVELEMQLATAKLEILKRCKAEYSDPIRNAGFELNETQTTLSNLIDQIERETKIKIKRV
jgi:hypothetical protein